MCPGRRLTLYRVPANAAAMLRAWVDFEYRIRLDLQDPWCAA